MAGNHRTLWLVAVLIVAIVGAIVARPGSEAPPAAAPARQSAAARDGGPAEPVSALKVDLQALGASRQEPTDSRRNPFRFEPKPVAPAPMPERIPNVPDDQVGAPPGPRTQGGPPPPPPITLKFIGIVETAAGAKIAVLSDGTRPIHGMEGQEIEGQYKILKIGAESIEIAYIDGRGRRTIPLTGQ